MSEAGIPSAGPKAHSRRPLVYVALLFLALWLLLSGKLGLFHVFSGVAATALIVWRHTRMPPVERADFRGARVERLIPYLAWLLVQMVLSALQVARVILSPDKHLDPRLVAFDRPMPSIFQSVLFGNSITLTPGTLTLDLKDQTYLVHALTEATAADLLGGEMASRVARLTGEDTAQLKEIPVSEIAPAS
ncbi:MAG: Na+/H+ antiporter subunit E [Verrucomicrobiota bacterium]